MDADAIKALGPKLGIFLKRFSLSVSDDVAAHVRTYIEGSSRNWSVRTSNKLH
jgi:hypothetical protein